MKITGKITAYLTDHSYRGPQDLLDESNSEESRLGMLHFSMNDMQEFGWSAVGEAEITVTLLSADGMVAQKLDALEAEKKKMVADHQVRLNAIEERISNLKAITFKPEVEA